MNLNQYMIVKVTPDGKSYCYWVVDGNPPTEPANSIRTAVVETIGEALEAELPALST